MPKATKSKPLKRITVQLSEELYKFVTEEAFKSQCSRSSKIRYAIWHYQQATKP